MVIKHFYLRVKKKLFPNFIKSNEYIFLLKKAGIEIGEGTVFFNPGSIIIDIQRPWMIKIGKYCKITSGTVILQHDYSRSVLRRVYGDVIGEAGYTNIGDNVFIGMNSIILMGAQIGDNTIIGAGSVVSGNIPSNCVAAGNPAKVIRSLDKYYEIRKSKYINEAKKCAILFKEKYKRFPTISEMGAFFPLYLQRDKAEILKNNLNINFSGDEENDILNYFLSSNQIYENYDHFLLDLEDNT